MLNNVTDNIIQYMSHYSLESILSGILEMQTLRYGRDDAIIPISEYFASNALVACGSQGEKTFMRTDYKQLERFGKSVLGTKVDDIFALTFKMVNKSENEKEKFLQSIMIQLKGSTFRGDGYIHQLVEVARSFYIPMDDIMKEHLGFSYSSYERVVRYIFSQYSKRIRVAYNRKNKIKNILHAIKGKGQLMVPSINEGYIFRITKDELKSIIGNEVDKLCEYLSIKAYSDNLTKVEYDDFKILTSKPFVDFGDYIYMPLLFSTLMNLPKIFHYSFIAEKIFDNQTIGLYTKNRGDVIEKLTASYLCRLIDNTKVFQSLSYVGEKGEADVTTIDTDTQLFCECKSKIITLDTFKGINESIEKDVGQAIGLAYLQGVRTANRVREGKKFITQEGKEITINNSANKYVVCVTAENFGIIPSEIEKYIQVDECLGIPYVVNIYDLDIITQECSSYAEFTEYIAFRNKNHKLISALDELDVFGYFKKYGNKDVLIDADELYITNWTQELDLKYRIKDKYVFDEFSR